MFGGADRVMAVGVVKKLLVLGVALAALGPGSAAEQPLVFDGPESTYSGVYEVRFLLRNAGPVRLYLNSFCPDRVVLEKVLRDGRTWIQAERWCCANAGAGSPQSLPPGGSISLKVPITFSVPGRFRIRAEHSDELWGNILQIPKHTETIVSPEFEVL